MAVKIRLMRTGQKKAPYYRVVVADSRAPRNSAYIDLIGTYNPMTNPATIDIDVAKAEDWMKKGAQPTDTARILINKKKVQQ